MKFVFSFVIVTLLQIQLFPAEGSDSLAQVNRANEIRNLFKQKSFFDKALSVPGKVLFFPFDVLFSGISYGIYKVDESKVIPKTRDFLISEDGRREVRPTYVSRIGVGLKYYQREILNPGSRLLLLATVGLHQRQRYGIALERVSLSELFYHSNYRALYEKLTTESFFGIGPNTEKNAKSDYTREMFGADISLGIDLGQRFTLQGRAGFELNNILPGRDNDNPSITDIYNRSDLPGLDTQANLFTFSLGFYYGSLNRPAKPSRGYELNAVGQYFQQVNADDFYFLKLSGDFRYYIPLFYERVLMIRFGTELTEPLPGKEVPFYYLSELGEGISFRGFERGRFRDFDSVLGSLEYRYPISNKLESILFVDAGQVSADIFNAYNSSNWEFSIGTGVRYVTKGGSVSKIELARSRDGFLVKITLN